MNKKQPRYLDLPVYEIKIDEDDRQGIRMVSLVKDPAIELKGMCFSAEDLLKEQQLQFKSIPDQQIIVGYAMLPNKKILRKDNNGNPYYVFFSEATVREMAFKFNKENSNKDCNVDHGDMMVPGFIRENWITEDEQYDKMKLYGFSPQIGGWAIIMRIEDSKFWQEDVKNAGRYSFSIEGLMGQQPADMSSQYNFTLQDKLDFIDTMTEEQLKELYFYVSIDDIPVHPHCRCEADEYIWVCAPDACDECKDLQQEYNKYASIGDFETAKLIFEKHSGKKFKKK